MNETYDAILIDIFNIYYRLRPKFRKDFSVKDKANACINYINDTKKYLTQDGKLFLLFDPIPKSDLGVFKSFTYNTDFEEKVTDRQRINIDYKAERKHDKDILPSVFFIKAFFEKRGSGIVTVYADNLEADDFVESIVADYSKVAMVTTDEDWCRYLANKKDKVVVMINKTFDEPFTFNDFVAKYNFNPTIKSVCMFKALFGDKSDNIDGVFTSKYGKFFVRIMPNFEETTFNFIKELSENETDTIDNLIDRIAQYNFKNYINIPYEKERIFFESVFRNEAFTKIDTIRDITKNLKLIKSRCKNFKKYATAKEVDKMYNKLVESSLGRDVPFVKQAFKFGIKIKK